MRSGSHALLVAVSMAAVLATPAAAQVPALDDALRQAQTRVGAPAATGAMFRHGQEEWSAAVGLADRRTGRGVTRDTPFISASTAKMMVATMVLQLVERDRLELTTTLSRYYPRLPGARRITVRMLLDHTSGLRDYLYDEGLLQRMSDRPGHRWTRAEVLRVVRDLEFSPGAREGYSNTNYIVLGGIIERVTRRRLDDVFRSGVAGPAGMTASTFRSRPGGSAGFAHPYIVQRGRLRDQYVARVGLPSAYWGEVWADGGLATTSLDLARFGDALFGGRLLRPETLQIMLDGRLAIQRQRVDGVEWLGHTGNFDGYESELWHEPRSGRTLAVMTNRAGDGEVGDAIWNALRRAAPELPGAARSLSACAVRARRSPCGSR